MPRNKFIFFLVINSMGIILVIIFLFFKSFSSPKVVCVDNIRLFDNFNMTKEMKSAGEREFKSIDLLSQKLQTSNSEVEKKQLSSLILLKKNDLVQFNDSFAQQESVKIWQRINGYLKDLSEENKYSIIIGYDNPRVVLFHEDRLDVTQEIIDYVNRKYEGTK
jgi:outer membrane protein